MGKAGGTGSFPERPKWRASAISWLCTLAILFQAVILQSHFHSAAAGQPQGFATSLPVVSSPAGIAGENGNRHTPDKNDQASCYLCQQLKLAGSTILPDSPALATVERNTTTEIAKVVIATMHAVVSHTWRSRAPPLSL